jgi:hypothetical protein
VQTFSLAILLHLAAGAVCFAHPTSRATLADFTPEGQIRIFLDTLPAVLSWPIALWHVLRNPQP